MPRWMLLVNSCLYLFSQSYIHKQDPVSSLYLDWNINILFFAQIVDSVGACLITMPLTSLQYLTEICCDDCKVHYFCNQRLVRNACECNSAIMHYVLINLFAVV